MKKIFILNLFIFSVVTGTAQNCVPLDHTFATGGIASGLSSISNSLSSAKIIVQPDNKILQVFSLYNSSSIVKFGLIRYKTNGSVDSSFGSYGIAETQIGIAGSNANSAALQQDGKIIVVGISYLASTTAVAVARYNSNGNLDSSFGTNGTVVTSIGVNGDGANDVAVQPDGKIVVAGYAYTLNYTSSFFVLRLLPNGTLDAGFGQSGKIAFHVGPFVAPYNQYASEFARAVAVQPDGKIVVAGTSYAYVNCYDYYGGIYCIEAFGMARFNPNGSIDSSFGVNGRVRDTLLLRSAADLELQPDGKLLVTGYGNVSGFITERYNINGSLDSSFGNTGKVLTNVANPGTTSESNSIAVLPNGKIIVVGVSEPGNYSFAAARYESNGVLDNTFNGTGMAVFHISALSSDYVTSVTLQDQKILIGGTSVNVSGSVQRIVVAKLNDNAPLITPTISAGGPLEFCLGKNVRLVSSEQGTIQWYKNDVMINGATDTAYVANTTGSYKVRVGNVNGCGVSPAVSVIANPNPPTPPINWITPEFSTTPGYRHYEWLLNNTPIAAPDSNVFRPAQTGNYSVTVIDSLSCRSTSGLFQLRALPVSDIVIGESKLRYYPNPVTSELIIEVNNAGLKKLEAKLFDLSGKLVHRQLLNQNRNQLLLSKLPMGIYQLVINDRLNRISVKLVVSK